MTPRLYDGTVSSTGAPTITGTIIAGDVPIFVQAFDTRNFGTGKTLTPSGSVIDGNGGVNYTYDFIEDTNGEIDRLAITVSAVTDTKTFDGTTGSIGVPTIAPR